MDGNRGKGNRESIGIEICVNADGDFERAKANTIELICYLIGKYNIPITHVVPHKYWSGKNCPANLLPQWNLFIAKIRNLPVFDPTKVSYYRLLKLTHPMMRGNDVTKVQLRLRVLADGIYGPVTKKAVLNFQKESNLQIDGIVGPKTWAALFQKEAVYSK